MRQMNFVNSDKQNNRAHSCLSGLVDQSESNMPNKNVAINNASPTIVADLSRFSFSIVLSFDFYEYRSLKSYKICASNVKMVKTGNFFISMEAFARSGSDLCQFFAIQRYSAR